jgi:hypothetical protein
MIPPAVFSSATAGLTITLFLVPATGVILNFLAMFNNFLCWLKIDFYKSLRLPKVNE